MNNFRIICHFFFLEFVILFFDLLITLVRLLLLVAILGALIILIFFFVSLLNEVLSLDCIKNILLLYYVFFDILFIPFFDSLVIEDIKVKFLELFISFNNLLVFLFDLFNDPLITTL